MIKVEVTLKDDTLDLIRDALAHFNGKNQQTIAPNTAKAVKQAAREVQKAWQNWAMGGSLDGAAPIKSANANLSRSIRVDSTYPFEAEIYTESPYMERIQNGVAEFDMKKTYPYGKKSRVSKKGIPYLIIPLRWGTWDKNNPGLKRAHFGNAMTEPTYNIVKAFKNKMRTTGKTHIEPNARGEAIERAEYYQGYDRLTDVEGNEAGMVRVPDIGQSSYLTFRIISAQSPKDSWKKEKVPANDVASALAKALEPTVNDILQAGLEADLDL